MRLRVLSLIAAAGIAALPVAASAQRIIYRSGERPSRLEMENRIAQARERAERARERTAERSAERREKAAEKRAEARIRADERRFDTEMKTRERAEKARERARDRVLRDPRVYRNRW